ncbi:MAG: hypothetical protein GSR86_06175 [Desulfurococcales archaeon]|nr:hypothetical protein [Desulfurococcales archaeon]
MEGKERMPRIDPGAYIIDVWLILSLKDPAGIAEWALGSDTLLVTSPTIVVVEHNGPPVRVALGPGSLVSHEEPPIQYYRLRTPQWVDACRIKGDPRYRVVEGGSREVDGVVMALEYRDPASMLVNGVRGTHIVTGHRGRAYAVIEGFKVLDWSREEGYLVYARSGEAWRRLSYIAPLASTCRNAAVS